MRVNQQAEPRPAPRLIPAEGALLDRLRRGDATAFAELVERYHLPLYRLAYRLAQERAAAEDLTQEVFLRAYRALGGFRRASSLKTWLFQIALNCWRDGRRKAPPPPAPLEEGRAPTGLASPDRDALAYLERRELQGQLQAALAQLPPKQRAACILRLLHDLPFREIGEIVGSPVATVKANYRLALLGLRRRLHDSSCR
jgi:RNA polymerase sigma-70 factor (ECF subfamily)